ncbi:MAG: SIS domain-containing protein, partial [Clostridia bacterium]|nr:SIS domain-containing protein [Clostridia bacterium]
IIAASQPGETADTFAALKLAKEQGAYTLGIVNVVGSSIAREADTVIYTWAGPEIAVASTKAYTVQASLFSLLAIGLGLANGRLEREEAEKLTKGLYEDLPAAIENILARQTDIQTIATRITEAEDLFFIGRNADYFAALEASLKLKEISYVHSEAYAAGELKHGTISLITEGTFVVALSTVKALEEKLCSNIKEVKARGARVISVVSAASTMFEPISETVFHLPDIDERFAFIAEATVLQLFAYYAAVARGCSVDQPRNLAKSVTVE